MHPNGILEVKRIINETDLTKLPSNTLDMMNQSTPLGADLLLDQINNA
jgi:hypothetical protein